MTEDSIFDVAVIGYGPTGATAANLLGLLGLNVVVIERDPDVYGRARAISTDEEVMRIWQSVGLADRLQQDMLPDRPIAFVDADHGADGERTAAFQDLEHQVGADVAGADDGHRPSLRGRHFASSAIMRTALS